MARSYNNSPNPAVGGASTAFAGAAPGRESGECCRSASTAPVAIAGSAHGSITG